MSATRRIHGPVIVSALACALLALPTPTLARHCTPSSCRQSAAWTQTKTQIRSALAQERYYMSFGRNASACPQTTWTPTKRQIRIARALERYHMGHW